MNQRKIWKNEQDFWAKYFKDRVKAVVDKIILCEEELKSSNMQELITTLAPLDIRFKYRISSTKHGSLSWPLPTPWGAKGGESVDIHLDPTGLVKTFPAGDAETILTMVGKHTSKNVSRNFSSRTLPC